MVITLECPCCGEKAAMSDADGWFTYEQPLMCGCSGHVSINDYGEVWIDISQADCNRCLRIAEAHSWQRQDAQHETNTYYERGSR